MLEESWFATMMEKDLVELSLLDKWRLHEKQQEERVLDIYSILEQNNEVSYKLWAVWVVWEWKRGGVDPKVV